MDRMESPVLQWLEEIHCSSLRNVLLFPKVPLYYESALKSTIPN